jgi:magnesium-transporting ATPase (P-type)
MDYKYIILICISSLWIFYDLYQENYHMSEFIFFFKNLVISNLVMTITLSLPIIKIITNKMYNQLLPENRKNSKSLSMTTDIILFYSIVFILLVRKKLFNKIVINPVFYVILWLTEILLRRNNHSSWKFNLLILFSLNIYLNEEYLYHNNINLALKQNLKGIFEYNYSIIYFGFILTFSVLYTLNKIFINYYDLYCPAKKLYTSVIFSSPIIWYLVTFFDILITNLFQTKTIACIYICYQQWRRFKQIRSIFPTLMFTTLEISYQLRAQIFLRKKQLEINSVDTFFSKMNSPEKIIKEKKENLEIGDFIVVNPDTFSPCSFIILGIIKENKIVVNKGRNPIEVIINTKSIDGESNDKKKISCDNITEIKEIIYQSKKDNNYLVKNPYIIRNGSHISKYNKNPVMGKVVNFENINNNYISYQKDFLDLFIIKINRFSISSLLIITTLFSVYSIIRKPFFDLNVVVDILLMNNILIPMTLPAFLVFIINNLKLNNPGNIYKEKGKRSLIQLVENSFTNDQNSIKGVHCTDKTGTLTQNSMRFVCNYSLKQETLINPESFLNKELIEKHISITQNSVQSPKMVIEEYEYSKGFGVNMQKKSKLRNNWEVIEYIWKNKKITVTRLLIGFFKKHKSVFSLIKNKEKYQLVIQGSPNTFKGLTGLNISNIKIPDLDKSLILAKRFWKENNNNSPFPEGCQRNWIIGWSAYFDLDKKNILLLESIANKEVISVDKIKLFNTFVNQIEIIPKDYLILIDKWRTGAKNITKYLNTIRFSFWILTGDNLENTIKIASSLNMNNNFIIIDSTITTQKSFFNFLINKMELCDKPATIFLNNYHQSLLENSGNFTEEIKKISYYLKIYINSVSKFHIACYSSEKKGKGGMVKFIRNKLNLETIYTGDGKNDICGFEESTISICLPNDGKYDPELSAVSDINAPDDFWNCYMNGEIFNNGFKIWNIIYIACVLSVCKQSITAGMSFSLSYITNFEKMEDPYDPFFYQFFQLVSFGTILIYCLKGKPKLVKKKKFTLMNIVKNYVFYYIIGFLNVIIIYNIFGLYNTNIYSIVMCYFVILTQCIFFYF